MSVIYGHRGRPRIIIIIILLYRFCNQLLLDPEIYELFQLNLLLNSFVVDAPGWDLRWTKNQVMLDNNYRHFILLLGYLYPCGWRWLTTLVSLISISFVYLGSLHWFNPILIFRLNGKIGLEVYTIIVILLNYSSGGGVLSIRWYESDFLEDLVACWISEVTNN